MTATPASALQQHPAFQGLSSASLKRLESEVRLLRYKPGQPLSAAAQVPSEILLIQEGQARLLVREQERLSTLRRLGSGDMVGLASLLRASGCEDVAASSPVLALAISDAAILYLLAEETSFQQWCASTLWPAELYALLEEQQQRRADQTASVTERFQALLDQARLVAPTSAAVEQALNSGQAVFLASANSQSLSLGAPLTAAADLPSPEGPLPVRLLSMPEEEPVVIATTETVELALSDSSQAASQPLATGQDLGRSGPLQLLELVQEGPLRKSWPASRCSAA